MIDTNYPVVRLSPLVAQRQQAEPVHAALGHQDQPCHEQRTVDAEEIVIDGELLERVRHQHGRYTRPQSSNGTFHVELEREYQAIGVYETVSAMHGNSAYHPGSLLSRYA